MVKYQDQGFKGNNKYRYRGYKTYMDIILIMITRTIGTSQDILEIMISFSKIIHIPNIEYQVRIIFPGHLAICLLRNTKSNN